MFGVTGVGEGASHETNGVSFEKLAVRFIEITNTISIRDALFVIFLDIWISYVLFGVNLSYMDYKLIFFLTWNERIYEKTLIYN